MFAIRMWLRNFFSFLILVSLAVPFVFTGGGCAVIVPPSGGPKDSLPPVIVAVTPPDRTTHFNEKKILMRFDEYIELDDIYKNLVISPLPKIFPGVSRKLKTITINIKDTLLPNTTYVYNFANAIKDLNEGNRAKDLVYIFSTGSYFDSLQLSGNVKIAQTGKADSTLVVMLHSNLADSAVVKERPRYIAKLDSSGTFLFRYLSPGTYRLYALKDEAGSYLYTSKQQIFAFADSPIVVSAQPPEPVKLYAYTVPEEKKMDAPEPDKKEKRLKFLTNLQGAQQELLDPFVMRFESPLKNFDSSKMKLYTDSTYKPVTNYKLTLDSTRQVLTMNVPWLEATKYNLILDKEFASDSLNRQLLKKDTLRFTTKAKKEYGQVKINFLDLKMSLNPVLLLLQNGNLKYSFPLRTNLLELELIAPGDYEMQVLQDRNKNGKWDPGAFFKEYRQPELVTPLKRKLNVKPNWMTEFEVGM